MKLYTVFEWFIETIQEFVKIIRVQFESLSTKANNNKENYEVSSSGAGIMEADDRQVTTVFTVQPSFHHRHSTNRES